MPLRRDVRGVGHGGADGRWVAIIDAVRWLTAAGVTVLREAQGRHVVMADPEGHEFCVC
ncbi:hypothetical protein I5Q34_04115 [Streptomyces sp. AV19]|uniref:VOC family protein n=1 Tax=Streptomyces sp. AV19 TaxID=2793068 RepID=UPI0018FF0980|nr:VOC family protein [Streptomyces sp. AV19]MBH1933480.1 hypothetical protein [Streptomyces sp. AV19]MDG4532129.1 hypothetical protein [Streptomyces sp. AV19]